MPSSSSHATPGPSSSSKRSASGKTSKLSSHKSSTESMMAAPEPRIWRPCRRMGLHYPAPAIATAATEQAAQENLPAGSSSPIPIPGVGVYGTSRPVPLPLEELKNLDRHYWDSEKGVLHKFAAGIGVGAHRPGADELFSPGSPPRRSGRRG